MATKAPKRTSKIRTLQTQGSLNPHPDRVVDERFGESEFFDPHDAAQVKYEMLRAVELEGRKVVEASRAFGFARRTYYEVRATFQELGIFGLAFQKRGPKGAHKLSGQILKFILEQLAQDERLSTAELADRVHQKFSLSVHPRSIERALARTKKK